MAALVAATVKVNNFTFAVDLARVGYEVAMFGKYLNSWSGKIQPGFSRWFANGPYQCTYKP